MQSAETVLGVLRGRGRRSLPLDELYRQLYNPQLYLLAYGRVYSNKGAMTPGATGETADGMSLGKIEAIIGAMRRESYRWSPVRRTYIPKKGDRRKLRPLGLPVWSDKLVGEVIRLLLEAYYEPAFSDASHGFRPGRGCHTALREVEATWRGTNWFIEADISDCFGSLDHGVMLAILAEKVHDNRFLRLVSNMLKAGYLEDWVWNATLSGAPQGGVVSPLLSNIYLDRLDGFVETVLIPEYTRGKARRFNREYHRVRAASYTAFQRGDMATATRLRTQMQALPSGDPRDPGYRRLRYVRYADDHLLGFAGPKSEAEQIKARLTAFLREELRLELSQEKTLITHARTRAARFLGYEITVLHADHKHTRGRRSVNGQVSLKVPQDVIKAKQVLYRRRGKPAFRTELLGESDYAIVRRYGQEWSGLVQYYLLAGNVHRLYRLFWVMQTSMLKTLANKHRSSVATMARKHRTVIATPHGRRVCMQARIEREGRKPLIATFGGIPLRRNRYALVTDRAPAPGNPPRKQLITRLLAQRCEICGSRRDITVHHIAKLADLDIRGQAPKWVELMARWRRKTLVVCGHCHDTIHHGRKGPSHT
jgi:group II intron reverse transcriptase/maturase